jgi:hypothetical protein
VCISGDVDVPTKAGNGTFTSMAKAEALNRDMESIVDLEFKDLVIQTPCVRAELEVIESSQQLHLMTNSRSRPSSDSP